MSSTVQSKIEMLREQTNQQDAANNSARVPVVEPVTPAEACIRVLLMGDQPIVRRGIRLVIEQQSRFSVVGEITNSEQELASFSEPYGIVVTDIASDIQGSLMHLGRIIKTAGDAGVIVLMQSSHPGLRLAVARLGALGVVSKEHHIESLLNAIVAVHIGEVWFDRMTIAGVVRGKNPPPVAGGEEAESKIASLTKRERQVIQCVGAGLNPTELAKRLFISEHTARHHLTSILDKLGVRDRFELTFYAYKHGLAAPPQ